MSWSWILLVLTTLLSRLSNTNTFELTSDEIDRLLANVSTGRGKYFTREPTPREGHREPYWEGGHWVFDSTRYKWLSTHIRHAWRHKWDRQKYRTSSTNMWCNPVCLRVYLNYGPICAFLSTQRLVNDSDPEWWDSREWHARRGAQPGTWHARRGARPGTWHARRGAQPGTWHARRGAQPGTYGTFNSLCDLERANCMHTQYRGACIVYEISAMDLKKIKMVPVDEKSVRSNFRKVRHFLRNRGLFRTPPTTDLMAGETEKYWILPRHRHPSMKEQSTGQAGRRQDPHHATNPFCNPWLCKPQGYGPVCAVYLRERLDHPAVENRGFRTFSDYCRVERENCQRPGTPGGKLQSGNISEVR